MARVRSQRASPPGPLLGPGAQGVDAGDAASTMSAAAGYSAGRWHHPTQILLLGRPAIQITYSPRAWLNGVEIKYSKGLSL